MRTLIAAAAALTLTGPTTAMAADQLVLPRCGKAAVRGVVGTKSVCLKRGTRCRTSQRPDYARFGFECRRKRLVRLPAGTPAPGEPVALNAEGRLPLSTALRLAGITGGRAPAGERGEDVSATMILTTLEAGRSKLTAEQRKAVDRLLDPPAQASAAQAQGQAVDAKTVTENLERARTAIEAHLPLKSGFKFLVRMLDKPLPNHPDWLASAALTDGGATCRVTIYPAFHKEVRTPAMVFAGLTHESWHCFQRARLGNTVDLVPAWLGEGQATWVEGVIADEVLGKQPSGTDHVLTNSLKAYISTPREALTERGNGAVGFWAAVAGSGKDGWRAMLDAIDAYREGGLSRDAFAGAISGFAGRFTQGWGPSWFRRPELGARWDLVAPQIPTTRPKPLKVKVANGTSAFLHSVAGGAEIADVTVSSDVVIVTKTGAADGTWRDSAGSEVRVTNAGYCARPGGCACPSGTTPQLGPRAAGAGVIGTTGGMKAATVRLRGLSLAKLCADPGQVPGSGEPVEDCTSSKDPGRCCPWNAHGQAPGPDGGYCNTARSTRRR